MKTASWVSWQQPVCHEREAQMKALVLNTLGRGFDFEDVDIAAPMGRQLLVNVQASWLCHTDLLFATHDIVPTTAALGSVGGRGRGARGPGSTPPPVRTRDPSS